MLLVNGMMEIDGRLGRTEVTLYVYIPICVIIWQLFLSLATDQDLTQTDMAQDAVWFRHCQCDADAV